MAGASAHRLLLGAPAAEGQKGGVRVVQLRAARNRRAPPEVWQATFAWLGTQRLVPLTPKQQVPKCAKRIEARRQLWEPYLRFLARSPHARVRHAAIHS